MAPMSNATLQFPAWAITPGFFHAGLLLAAIPILIHLLNRRRFKIVPWAAMEYLLAAMRKNRRRLRFEQLLLLAVRCSLLALLGLALARPLACSDSSLAAFAGEESGLHIFVIDNSYSMAYESAAQPGKTHLDAAKALAHQQIQRLNPGADSVAIVVACRFPPKTPSPGTPGDSRGEGAAPVPNPLILLQPTFDPHAAEDAIDRIEQSFLGTDIPGALQLAAQIAREDTRQPLKHLHIYSDCTRSAWDRPENADMLKQLGPTLISTFQKNLSLHDLSQPDQSNYAILGLDPDAGLVTPTFHTDFLADVKAFGSSADSTVQWRWDDNLLPETTRFSPEVAAEPLRQTRMQITQGGPHVIAASVLADDKLRLDNTRFRVVEVASAMRVLIVEGARGVGSLSGAGAYLDLSLAPKKERDAAGHIRSSTYVLPEIIPDLDLPGKPLADYRAVVLASVSSLTASEADQLARFVEAGGALMVFMGDQVNADLYNSVLLPRKLMPGRLIARKTLPADGQAFHFDFNPNSPLHPVLGIFKGETRTGLDTAQIFTYFQIQAPPDATVLRYLPDPKTGVADPAITLHTLGHGHVVFFSTTANSEWNALPQKPSFIPLIHELLANSVQIGDQWMNLQTGQSLQLPPTLRITAAPTLTDGNHRPIPIDPVALSTGQTLYCSKPLSLPGLYKLTVGGQTIPIAVNIPADEADIRPMPRQAVAAALGDVDVRITGAELDAPSLSLDKSTDLGWTLLCAVLLLAGAECFLAMHFGHYRRTMSRPGSG
jgi:hypothetical protein